MGRLAKVGRARRPACKKQQTVKGKKLADFSALLTVRVWAFSRKGARIK
jgi:hypothetical protein